MFFSKRVKFIIGLFLIFFQLNFSFADFLTSRQKDNSLNQALSPNSQLNSLDTIFSVALRMVHSGLSEEEIWNFLKAYNNNIIGVSINNNCLNIEITDKNDNSTLYEFNIDKNTSELNKIFESVKQSLNKPLEIISGAKELIQASISSVQILINSWKLFFIASIISFIVIFSPYNAVEAAVQPASVITAKQQVKELALQLKKEELINASISIERKKIDESFYQYIFDSFKEASYSLFFKIDPHSKEYGNSSAFKLSARNYSNEKAQENIDDIIKGLNWTMHEESKKFTMIAKIAKKYDIDPTILMTIRVFEKWDLSYGEQYTDFFKASFTDKTSVGAYQIRIDKMEEYLKSAYSDPNFIKQNYTFFKRYPTFDKFIEYNKSIKTVLEADNEVAVELAIIFLKKHTEVLKETFPNIFDNSFSLKDCTITDNESKNVFNVFSLAYTYDLIGNHKGDSMLEIFQKIKKNKPDLYLWMKIESKTLELLQGIIRLYHNENFNEITEIKGFNLNDFTHGASKNSLPSEMLQNSIIKFSIWGAVIIIIGGIFYKIRKFFTKNINKKNKNTRTAYRGKSVNLDRRVFNFFQNYFKFDNIRRNNSRDVGIMYSNKLFPLKITPKANIRTLENFLKLLQNAIPSIILEIKKQDPKSSPNLSDLYLPVYSLINKYNDRSDIIYELYKMQSNYLKNGALNFEHKQGMINLAFIDLIAKILNKNINYTFIGQREINNLQRAA